MKRNSIIIHQAVDFAWATFKKHYGLLIAILLTIFGAWVALEIVVIAGRRFGILWWAAAHLAFFFFFAGIEVGFIETCFALYDGEKPTFADTFRHLTLGLKFLAGQTLYLLITMVGLVLQRKVALICSKSSIESFKMPEKLVVRNIILTFNVPYSHLFCGSFI